MYYKNAGVDIEAGYESVELMKKYVKGTMRPEVLGGLGGFSVLARKTISGNTAQDLADHVRKFIMTAEKSTAAASRAVR